MTFTFLKISFRTKGAAAQVKKPVVQIENRFRLERRGLCSTFWKKNVILPAHSCEQQLRQWIVRTCSELGQYVEENTVGLCRVWANVCCSEPFKFDYINPYKLMKWKKRTVLLGEVVLSSRANFKFSMNWAWLVWLALCLLCAEWLTNRGST